MAAKDGVLRPTARQYPHIDNAAMVLADRLLDGAPIPGVSVSMRTYGPNGMFKTLGKVEGPGFCLKYGRQQGATMQARGGPWNDTGAISEMVVGRRRLEVFADNSGPRLVVFVGREELLAEWQEEFWGFPIMARLKHGPRQQLYYSGSHVDSRKLRHTATPKQYAVPGGQVKPFLLEDDDLGREYLPENEPRCYLTDQVLQDFGKFMCELAARPA